MLVPFTQYLLPDGRPRPIQIDRPEKVGNDARWLIEQGVRFEAEILRTGEVSFTADVDDSDGETQTLAIEICPNGPSVDDAVDRLITRAAEMICEVKGASDA